MTLTNELIEDIRFYLRVIAGSGEYGISQDAKELLDRINSETKQITVKEILRAVEDEG